MIREGTLGESEDYGGKDIVKKQTDTLMIVTFPLLSPPLPSPSSPSP